MRFVVEEMDMARQMFSAREREIKMRSSELRRKIEARAVAGVLRWQSVPAVLLTLAKGAK